MKRFNLNNELFLHPLGILEDNGSVKYDIWWGRKVKVHGQWVKYIFKMLHHDESQSSRHHTASDRLIDRNNSIERVFFSCFIDCGWLRGVLWRTHCCCEFHYIGCVWISLNLIARRLRLIINKNKHREQCKGKGQHDLSEHGSHSVCAGRTEMFESIREAQSRENSQCGENCTTKKQQFPHRDNSATVWISVPCLFVDF